MICQREAVLGGFMLEGQKDGRVKAIGTRKSYYCKRASYHEGVTGGEVTG